MDLTALAGAATALFNAMLEAPVTDVSFSTSESIGDEDDDDGSAGGAGDAGGVAGDVGDGAEFSPLRDVLCEFTGDLLGDSALEDLVTDGTLDLQRLQGLPVEVPPPTAISTAFRRLFPHGVQPLRAGQPLRTRTDANGSYFLPVAPARPGFVRCLPRPELAITTVVPGRQRGTILTGQDVSPPSHLFAAVLLPRLAPQDSRAMYETFLDDIGNLREPAHGVIQVETVPTNTGPIMADTDGDDIACEFLGGVGAAQVEHPAAGGAALAASTLFKGLLVEASQPAAAGYTLLLTVLLTRTTDTNVPLLKATGADLVLGGRACEPGSGHGDRLEHLCACAY